MDDRAMPVSSSRVKYVLVIIPGSVTGYLVRNGPALSPSPKSWANRGCGSLILLVLQFPCWDQGADLKRGVLTAAGCRIR